MNDDATAVGDPLSTPSAMDEVNGHAPDPKLGTVQNSGPEDPNRLLDPRTSVQAQTALAQGPNAQLGVPATSPPEPRTRGQKRRAKEAVENEPASKAPRLSAADGTSAASASRSRKLDYNKDAKPLRRLILEVGSIILVKEVSHQLDNRPTPEWRALSSENQTYFTVGTEKFCSKWRPHIVTKCLPHEVRCVPMYTHNGKGLQNKSTDERKAFVSVRDTRKFPLDDPDISFHAEGEFAPLLIEETYDGWEGKEKSTAELCFHRYNYKRKALKVGKLQKESMDDLMELLKGYLFD